MLGIVAGLFFVLFIVFSTMDGIRQRPTTEGMLPDSVVYAYYDAFSSLNHTFMESCINGADKTDINAAASYYAVAKTRQSYENTPTIPIKTARAWRESGGELPAPDVFGVTDLTLTQITDSSSSDMVIFRAVYSLWAPNEFARNRTDILTLRKDRKKNWRITEILRTER